MLRACNSFIISLSLLLVSFSDLYQMYSKWVETCKLPIQKCKNNLLLIYELQNAYLRPASSISLLYLLASRLCLPLQKMPGFMGLCKCNYINWYKRSVLPISSSNLCCKKPACCTARVAWVQNISVGHRSTSRERTSHHQ